MARSAFIVSLILAAALLVSCGSGDTTTVIREAPPETVERTTTVEGPPRRPQKSNPARRAPSGEPPNVLGLPLPAAKLLLKQAGYRTVAKNTDTTFGIIVPENYTICKQGEPRGSLVVVLAQKYGC